MNNEKVGKRVHIISFRVNDEEKDLIERHAAKAKEDARAKQEAKAKNRNVFVREKLVEVLSKK